MLLIRCRLCSPDVSPFGNNTAQKCCLINFFLYANANILAKWSRFIVTGEEETKFVL